MNELIHLNKSWFVVAASSDIKRKPVGTTILGKNIVLFRSVSEVVALEDRCPHRNVPLSLGSIVNGSIKCAYHGWEFEKDGNCRSVPGLRATSFANNCRVPKYPVFEVNGLIWVNLDPAARREDVPLVQLADQGTTTHQFMIKVAANASLINGLENLLDGFHTPFVHSGLVRTAQDAQAVTARITASKDRVEIQYTGEKNQSGSISRLFERERTSSYGRFILPSIAQLEYRSPRRTELMITAYFSSTSTNQQTIHAIVETPRGLIPAFLKKVVLGLLFRQVLRQDLRILEAQSKNLNQFGSERFVSTRLDLIRPYILNLLEMQPNQGHSPPNEKSENFEL